MKKAFLTLLLFSFLVSTFAQDKPAKTVKQFYTEMGGPGILFSANFDTRFVPGKQVGLGMRVGLGFTIQDSYYDVNNEYTVRTVGNLPIGLNYLFGKETSAHTFEVGAGATILFKKTALLVYNGNEKRGNLMGYFQFMYRRQPLNGGFTWRIGFTPLINTAGDIVPFAAGGIGYTF